MPEPISWAQQKQNPLNHDETTYEFGISTGIVSINEVRYSPYHKRIQHNAPDAKSLVDGEISELHTRDWDSRVTTFDVDDEGQLAPAESAVCHFASDYQEYYTNELEEFRDRVLEKPARHGKRLLLLEDVTPPVMEVIGFSLNIDPELFKQHIDYAWGCGSNSIGSSIKPGVSGSQFRFASIYPRLIEVYHPLAFKSPDWRNECFRRAARYLQCRQLSPIFDIPDQNKVLCTSFEFSTTNIFQLGTSHGHGWNTVVLFPTSVKTWEDGSMRVRKHEQIDPRPHVRSLAGKTDSADPDVAVWLASLKLSNKVVGGLRNPLYVIVNLFREGLLHWEAHTVYVARAVDELSSLSDSARDDGGLRPQTQLKQLIYQSTSVLSELMDSINSAIELDASFEATSRQRKGSRAFDPLCRQSLQELKASLELIRTKLERHLPALQHHIDLIRVRQQVQLAETQLEESRKAIQQADTIKRLTILAFVYIPIQTAASIFGMNVGELSRSPSIWTFVVVALVMLSITILAAGWHHIQRFAIRSRHRASNTLYDFAAEKLEPMGIRVNADRQHSLNHQMENARPSWVF